ncbi:MAG TPA: hypothetical protein VGV91_05155 [Rubrobacter sp.]|nr:hypothetical protein [Rubrobacter sp.]
MSDDTQKRLISVIATAIAFVLASRLAEDFLDQPERRGVGDDVKEGLLQASFSLLSTVVASALIRRALGGR